MHCRSITGKSITKSSSFLIFYFAYTYLIGICFTEIVFLNLNVLTPQKMKPPKFWGSLDEIFFDNVHIFCGAKKSKMKEFNCSICNHICSMVALQAGQCAMAGICGKKIYFKTFNNSIFFLCQNVSVCRK